MAESSTEHLCPGSLRLDSDRDSDISTADYNAGTGYTTNKRPETQQYQIPPVNHVSSSNTSFGQEIRRYPKIAIFTLGLATTAFLSGYDNVIVNTVPSIAQFKKDFGEQYGAEHEYIIPSMWLSLWSALGCLGGMIGALVSGPWQDRVGRRWPLAIGSLLSAVAVAIVYTSNLPAGITVRRTMFLIGEMIQGLVIGVLQTTAHTYISETVPAGLRGSAMALIPTLVLTGQLAGALVCLGASDGDAQSSYLVAFGSMWAFCVAPLVVAILIPESPAFLIRHGRLADAHSALKKLHRKDQDCEQIIEDLRNTIDLERRIGQKATYRDCFRGSDRRRTLIVAFTSVMPCFFGLSLLSNASYFLQLIGMDDKVSLVMFALGIGLGLVANAVSVWINTFFTRRFLMLITLSVTTLLWLGMGISGFWSGPGMIWWTAGSMIAIIIFCGVGVWPSSYAVTAETSSLRLRAKTLGIGILSVYAATIVFSFTIPYVYNRDAGNLGAKTGFVYFGLCLITTAGVWWAIPEMKGRSSFEIDHMFEKGLSARKFKDWSGDGSEGGELRNRGLEHE
ncbi:MFS general substrate transporter [Penicillium capsulatum]|uniref:MFS general substrate transporter n=1 Tax=Penicillium capsulatum TaxID=69766 RepID=A0A9W9IB31_9EURO|nr:MFS general substrate transporter [Penicillium capsulatum]KAJ6136067.1 MFS general substrate transporter [Penicillium capsulatum]